MEMPEEVLSARSDCFLQQYPTRQTKLSLQPTEASYPAFCFPAPTSLGLGTISGTPFFRQSRQSGAATALPRNHHRSRDSDSRRSDQTFVACGARSYRQPGKIFKKK